MALATIGETIQVAGTPSVGAEVTVTLVAATAGTAFGYTTVATEGGRRRAATDATGAWSLDAVAPNVGSSGDVITLPAGTVYRIDVRHRDGTVMVPRFVEVPDSVGPHDIVDILAVAPDALVDSAVEQAIDAEATARAAADAALAAALAAEAATRATADSTEAAVRAAAGASLELLKDDRIQGRRFGSPALTGWELAKAIAVFQPARVVFVRDSHGELGVDDEFDKIAARRFGQRLPTFGTSGRWVPARRQGSERFSHSGAVDASSGPGGWGATLSAGSWMRWGDGVYQVVTGWKLYGVGTFLIESLTAGGSVLESATVTLTAGVAWTSTSATTFGPRQLRVTGSGAGGVVWGAFMALDNLSTGYQPWQFAHSGWAGDDSLANTATWTMIDALDPALVVIGMATNETDAASYRTNTEALIERARLTDADRSVALWFPHLSSASGDDEDWWDGTHQAFREMCVDMNCAAVDLYALWGDLSTSDPHGLIDVSDFVHLSALGNALASLVQASVLLDDSPYVRPVDASGGQPADMVKLRNISPGFSDVEIIAGNAATPSDMVTVARGGTWVPVGAGTPTLGQHLTTKTYVDALAVLTAGASQPLDSDLTAIAALSTTAYGRALLTTANLAALRAAQGVGGEATGIGVVAATLPRDSWLGNVTLVSGRIHATTVELVAGQVITSLTFFSGSQLAVLPTNQWFFIADSARAVQRFTVNDTTTAWAANSAKSLALTSTYTVPTSGTYYVGIMVTATTTVPNILGTTSNAAVTAWPPIRVGVADLGLTAVPGLPFSFAALTPVAGIPIVWAT